MESLESSKIARLSVDLIAKFFYFFYNSKFKFFKFCLLFKTLCPVKMYIYWFLINEYFCLKDLVPSTINRGITGQKFYPRDRGVLTYHMDPYLTTTQRDHRAFTK